MQIDNIRREYQLQQLDRGNLADDPFIQFENWFSFARQSELSTDPTAMVVATTDGQGRVSQRVVLLKAYDQQGFVFYTNLKSKKAVQLQQNPQCSLHFAWLPLEQQIIIEGDVEYLSTQQNEAYFQSRPRASQIASWASAQSRSIENRAVLDAQYEDCEKRFAGQQVPLPPFWGGIRVRPQYIEFWQGRASRLHDRFAYQRDDDRWSLQRLQP